MSGQRVLIVDDEPQILRALRATLHGAGYTVDVAATAEEAGRGMPAVMIRWLEALAKIKDYASTEEQHRVLLEQAAMILRASRESVPEEADRADVQRRYDALVLGS